LFTIAATFAIAPAHAGEAAKEPKTGKSCVSFISSELTNVGKVKMNYRNICANPFQIRISSGENTREGTIEAGSPDKPSRAFITCNSDERCEVAKWKYE
jgi:hypothetical protein